MTILVPSLILFEEPLMNVLNIYFDEKSFRNKLEIIDFFLNLLWKSKAFYVFYLHICHLHALSVGFWMKLN
jgi:hypothetical protein